MELPQRSRLVVFVTLAGMALLSAGRVLQYDPVPWEWVAAFAVATLLLAGPVSWLLRDRVTGKRRTQLGYVAGGIAVLLVPLVLGLGLLFGNLLLVMDTGVLGGVLGLTLAGLAERTVVPDRYRRS